MMLSIHLRLGLAASAVLALFLGLTGLALDRAHSQSLEQAQQARLEAHIYALLAAAQEDEAGRMRLPPSLPDPRLTTADSGLYAMVRGEQGGYVWHSVSLLGREPEFLTPAAPGQTLFARREQAGETLFSLSFGILWEDFAGRELHYTLAAAESAASLQQRVQGFRASLFTGLGSAAAILLLAQWGVLHWGLHPLRRSAQDLKRVERGEAQRLEGVYPKELQRLTGNINAFIGQSQAAQERYRNRLADLAHSLKTPLAVLQGALAAPGDGQLRNALVEQLPRIQEIVQFQLRRSVGGGHNPAQATPVAEPAARLLRTLDKVYRARAVECTAQIDPRARYFGDPGDLLELLGNLLDNAFKYGHQRVALSAAPRAEGEAGRPGLLLEVADDGPGIPEHRRQDVLRRGQRHDQRQPGQGIGLHVAAEIVELNGGRLEITESQWGGALVRVVF